MRGSLCSLSPLGAPSDGRQPSPSRAARGLLPLPAGERAIRSVLVVFFIALALSACGKKGLPEPPEGTPSTYPRSYPRG